MRGPPLVRAVPGGRVMSRTHAYNQPRGPDGSARRYLAYGADYNPEQWSREVWAEDVRLMRVAGVNIVNMGFFSWARLTNGTQAWDFTLLVSALPTHSDNSIISA